MDNLVKPAGSGEDGQISTDFASSPTKSVLCDLSPGASDLVWKLGNKTSGIWEVNFDYYVQSGYSGYYNIQKTEVPGTQWAFEMYFHTDGRSSICRKFNRITFTYPKNTWFPVVNHIDLNADLISIYVNGILVHTWPYHYTSNGTTGMIQLGGVDFFAGAEGTDTPKFYFDDAELHLYSPSSSSWRKL